METIDIVNPNQLPHNVRFYVYSEEEFEKANPKPELAYRLTRKSPRPGYVEYYVPEKAE